MRHRRVDGQTWLVLVGIAAAAPRARADAPPPPVSLVDVLAVAVRQAPELERATLDVEAARATLQRAVGSEDLKLTATTSFQRQYDAGLLNLTALGSLDLGKQLSTGGSLHLTASSSDIETAVPGVPQGSFVTSTTQLSLVQPLLRNFGSRVARQPRYEAAHRLDAAAAAREGRARTLVEQIVIDYWQVALARATLEVRKGSLALAEQQRKYTQNSIDIGKIPKSELLAMEQVIAIRKQDVALAELDVTQRSLDLRQVVGMEIGADALDVATVELPNIRDEPLDVRATVALALERNADLLAFVRIERAVETRIAVADNAMRPNLDVSLSAGPAGIDTSWSGSFKRMATADGYQVGASLTAVFDFQRNDPRGQVRQTRADVQRAKVDVRAARQQIAARAARAVQLARVARARVELGERAIALAMDNIEAEQHRFEDRKSTNFDIIRRQDELEQAKLRRLVAIVDYLTARATIDALTGAILTTYGIALPSP
jgi:outer membrane protein TolC